MHYLAIAVVVFAVALAIALSGRVTARAAEPAATPPAAAAAPAQPAAKTLSRAEIAKRLQALATNPAPKKLNLGAMCYDMAGPPERFEYVCPTCGEKTLYARHNGDRQGDAWILDQTLLKCRRLAAQIKTLDLKLDEAQFCQKCRPGVTKPALALVVTYPDDPAPRRMTGVTDRDLDRLIAFLAGQDRYDAGQDREVALKDELARLRELLGFPTEPPAQPPPKDKP